MTAVESATIAAQRRLVAANPRDVIALHNLGVELRKADRLDEALAVMERALALGATAPETATVYAHLLADFGRFDEAVAAYLRVLAANPGHLDAHETLLGVNLTPRRVVAPRAGMLVLFPSYFWHGTLPFTSATPRLTVAFDALPVDKSPTHQ